MSQPIKHNLEVLKHDYQNWKAEIASTTAKTKAAWDAGDYLQSLHHATGYIEETIDQMPRLWFYTWLPKYALIAYLLW